MRRTLFAMLALCLAACAIAPAPHGLPPEYELTELQRSEVAQMQQAVAAGNQAPHISASDPAFLAHFLRAIGNPNPSNPTSMRRYEIGFQQLLSRDYWGWKAEPLDLSDPRLDWDIWNAFLQVENIPVEELPQSSAWQLLLRHIWTNAAAIVSDPARGLWWINEIFNGSRSPRRSMLVLFLASCLDSRSMNDSKGIYSDSWDGPKWVPLRSTPDWPWVTLKNEVLPPELQSFEGAMNALAGSLDYSWEAWGFATGDLPPPSTRPTAMLDLNSWGPSTATMPSPSSLFDQLWELEISRILYSHWAVAEPVFSLSMPRTRFILFANNGTLFSWPREQMADAALKLAVRVGLLQDSDLPQFFDRGYKPLGIAASGT
jgi:hypothetical protein